MKKSFIVWSIASMVVMLLFPWFAITFVKGDGGMAVCFLLFFLVNPIYSILAGVFAGRNYKIMWMQPILLSGLFLSGAWLFFDIQETAFVLYAGIYLIIGLVSMFASALITKHKGNQSTD